MEKVIEQIAGELGVAGQRVNAAVELMDGGATVPFIARYRKEKTGGLDDVQLRRIEERLAYLRELEERRAVILKSIGDQGKLTAELAGQIGQAETKTRLEDLYLPYRPKKRTRAQIAREAGLEELAYGLLKDPGQAPEDTAAGCLNADKGFPDVKSALDGARQILMEDFSVDAELIGRLREYLWEHGVLKSEVIDEKKPAAAKFSDYFDFQEPVSRIPSHRALALFRGRNEGVLNLELLAEKENQGEPHCEGLIARRFGIENLGRPADGWLQETVRWSWKVKIHTHLDLELKMQLRRKAEEEAIRVFGSNLHDLLLAPPAGDRVIMGLDPGLRTGVKVAVVDETGKVVETATIYPHPPRKLYDEAIHTLAGLAQRHGVGLLAIGNGTASRETDLLAADLISRHPQLKLRRIVVSEAGASVYSASEIAASELPDLDVTLRGAVSIARRLQDPLAELVKIDPKSIGVGQYQHDVNQSQLARTLDNVVEDCVNSVGVDVNTASPALLTRVSGLTRTLADNIVRFRDENGRFSRRKDLQRVPRFGAKTYELAAGFLRIREGDNPLDASAVHPEAYPVVEKILRESGKGIVQLIGDKAYLGRLKPGSFTDERFGLPTVMDILRELEKPGRDPRGEFKTASFQDNVTKMEHLEPGMMLEGVVTNVTNFGAFVDVGVHQDGLVHISAMSEKFIRDPREVVKTGDLVKVRVMEVDLARKRIALSMRPDAAANPPRQQKSGTQPSPRENRRNRKPQQPADRAGTMAAALSKALKRG